MLTFLVAVAVSTPVQTAPPAPAPPALTAPQSAALRCGVVFALAARMQAARNPLAASWPPLAARGKEFFVRVTAKLMDETGASRADLAALATRELPALQSAGSVAAALPGCLPMLTAAGL